MIELQKLTIQQGDFVLNDIELTIADNVYCILMGATGTGKTTLLEAICGLRRITGGRILLDDRDVASLAPAQREIGYVPQDGVLFPTMRVDRQIGFGMEVRNIDRNQRQARVRELAELLEIENLLNRYPRGLSGGEKQRIVLARALSFRPKLLCLDEPLSALDGSTRTRLAELLKTVHQHEGITVLHITHSLDEGERLGTAHFHLVDGKIV